MNVSASKKLIIFLFLILLIGGFFWFKKTKSKEQQSRYVLAQVEKGEIIISVSGSGQILPSEQTEIRPKISGEIEEIFVEEGQRIKEGNLLLKLKSKDFERAIDDAKLALEDATTKLKNLKKDRENLTKDLKDAYEDAFNAISDTFNDLSEVTKTLERIFTESSYGGDQGDIDYYRNTVGFYSGQSFSKNEKENRFLMLKEKYQSIRNDYLLVSKGVSVEILEDWLKRISDLVKEIADLARSGKEIISFYKETILKENLIPPFSLSITENQLVQLNTVIVSLDQRISTLSSVSKKIDNLKDTISDYQEKIDFQENTIKQKEDALEKAKENYENCFIFAPFSGQIAKVNVRKGDIISPSISLFTLISEEKVAQISLNEIEAAKVKVGQKARLTFDAVPDLTLTGKVTEIETVGTIFQGVVSYGVKIILDSDDERIKPSMSVTAEILVDSKNGILVLPNGAIKTKENLKYVEVIEGPQNLKKQLKIKIPIFLPKGIQIERKIVETGISNENFTEIVSGLKEGDIAILAKVSPQTVQTPSFQPQFRFQIPGMGRQVPR